MKITTQISSQNQDKNRDHHIRNHKLTDLIQNQTFPQTIFLLWTGQLPSKEQEQFFNALLVAAVEHGPEVPSLFVPRVSTSVGNPPRVALAAGMLSIGTKHGGAIQACADLLASDQSAADIVTDYLATKTPIPGFGHRLYKEADPRATALYQKAQELKIAGKYFKKTYQIETELKNQKRKTIPVNIDGAMAAGLLDLGLDPAYAEPLFLLSRTAGMSAHIIEEQQQNNPYYRL